MTTQAITGRSVLRASISSHRRHVGIATLFLVGHQTGEALVPVLIGVIVDQAVSIGNLRALAGWLVVLGLDFTMLSFSYRWGARRSWRADVLADQRLRLLIAERVLDPHGGAEAGRLPGVLASIAVSDTKRVGVVNFAVPIGLASVAALVVAAISLLRISVPVGLLILLGSPPLLYVVHLLGKPLQQRSGPEQERAARASGVAADLVSGVRVLKGIGAEPAAIRRYIGHSRQALDATLGATGAQAWYRGAVLAANGLFLALVALVGGRLAAAGELSIGGLVAAVGLAQFLLTPLEIFGWVNGRLAQGRTSAARVAEILNTPPAVSPGSRTAPDTPAGQLRLHELGYGPLRCVNLTVPVGELLGVVAADPAEALALMHCLGREVDPASGMIELDGVKLDDYPPADARRAVLAAAHDAELFSGTIRDNVLAGAPTAQDLDRALRAAQADQVIDTMPASRDAEITEQGSSLSGGQRQRVALARALATQAAVLVLHDPTTAVDAVTEARIAAGLRQARRGRTTIVLTTSPALLAVTDRVVVLAGGRITAEGTHAALVDSRADYRDTVLS
ncbi:MAG: ABC transporter ATP-binding protein [Pseudonocardiaceae bacterium]